MLSYNSGAQRARRSDSQTSTSNPPSPARVSKPVGAPEATGLRASAGALATAASAVMTRAHVGSIGLRRSSCSSAFRFRACGPPLRRAAGQAGARRTSVFRPSHPVIFLGTNRLQIADCRLCPPPPRGYSSMLPKASTLDDFADCVMNQSRNLHREQITDCGPDRQHIVDFLL